jgi:hypothetical protein
MPSFVMKWAFGFEIFTCGLKLYIRTNHLFYGEALLDFVDGSGHGGIIYKIYAKIPQLL